MIVTGLNNNGMDRASSKCVSSCKCVCVCVCFVPLETVYADSACSRADCFCCSSTMLCLEGGKASVKASTLHDFFYVVPLV